MATQNLIQIKRSETTQKPTGLANGELAWSGNGDVLWIGNFGTDYAIGGNFIKDTGNVLTVSYDAEGKAQIDLDNTTVTAGSYGNTTAIPTFTVDAQGRLTAANTVDVATELTIVGDSGANDTIDLLTDSLSVLGATGLTTYISNNVVTINLDNTAVTGGTYGDANTVAQFTVDAQGRLTNAADVDIDHDALLNFVANEHIDHSTVSILQGAGLSGSNGDITASRTITVGQGVGITVNAADVAVNPGNGITANATGTHVEVAGDSSLTANSSGLFIEDSTLSIATTQLTGTILFNQIAPAAVITEAEGIGSNDNDTTLPTSAAVKDYVDTNITAQDLDITDGSVTSAVDLDSQTLTVQGTANEVEVGLSGQAFTVGLPNDVTVSNNLNVGGDLTVSGNVVSIDVTELKVEDAMIHLASNNTSSNLLDMGFVGQYSTDGGTTQKHQGFVWDASASEFILFDSFEHGSISSTSTIDTSANTFNWANLHVGVLNLETQLAVSEGGTGKTSVTTNAVLYGQGTAAMAEATGSAYQVLQLDASGVPVFNSLDGGTF